MSFRLVDAGWDAVLAEAVNSDRSAVRIVCPFVKRGAVERLLAGGTPGALQVITRFNLGDFADGVSDIAALRLLLGSGAAVRGVRNLHAKLYLFGGSRAVVTSANLTEAALLRNHEFGFVADDAAVVRGCRQYFDGLWGRSGPDLTAAQLDRWDDTVALHLAGGTRPGAAGLGDEGADAGIPPGPAERPAGWEVTGQAFVKFFGESDNRAARSLAVLEEVRRSGCHWACTYPRGKRPRQVEDGAVLFMGRMVKDPNDILVYGHAVGMRHTEGRDDATAADIAIRPWKETWPHYVRVHHAGFVAGSLANGVSLNELMDHFRADAFEPTRRNAVSGAGNTDPRMAYRQQPAVELTRQATAWLYERLGRAYARHGRLTQAELDQLDWPATLGRAALAPVDMPG